ncbi:putative serine racemase, Ammonia-lyase [Helianthus debilis subsp. tardiflorus]
MACKKYGVSIDTIQKAQILIKEYINLTPVIHSTTLNSLSRKTLFFKSECFQKSGAFKFRGAANAVFSLQEEQAAKGVVTHSSGNHAAALSLAAQLRRIPSYVVIPNTAPKCKVANVKRYGGIVRFSEPTMQSREETAIRVLQETGAVLVPSSNDVRIISGQGTLSLEFLDQAPELDTLIVPISGLYFLLSYMNLMLLSCLYGFFLQMKLKHVGGGLLSGVAIGAKSKNPAIRVLGAEPKGADDAAQSKACGRLVSLSHTNTIADGLRASMGDITWPIVRDLVDDIITVNDEEILEAIRYSYEILKVAVEPSAAIGLAAVLSDNFKKHPCWNCSQNIGIVISGGNVDLGALWESISRITRT